MSQEAKEQQLENLVNEEDDTWWRAGEIDSFDLNKKLLRVGCRPVYRKLITCQKELSFIQNSKFCLENKAELDKCLQMLKFVYATKKD